MTKRLVILGAGESGVGAALLAKQKGFDVFVSDMGTIKPNYINELTQANIAFEQGGHTEALITNATEVIKSPGIPEKAPLIKQLRKAGIPVISEIEFAARFTTGKKICITGSNGKTTTTLLIYHILKEGGENVELAGNVGTSFARQIANGLTPNWWVIELSSFQLDDMYDFKAEIAILMNITPDHLDRYEYKMENYVDSKFRIIQNQTENDFFIYCADDLEITEKLKQLSVKSTHLPFGFTNQSINGATANQTQFTSTYNNNSMSINFNDIALQGRHNAYNSMAAAITSKVANIRKDSIRQSLGNFKGVEHRLEKVLSIRGIEFINDSKATNVNSTWYALECMNRPVIWIAGGVDKGNDYTTLIPLVSDKVKVLICMGIDNKKLVSTFRGVVPTVLECASMYEAIQLAYSNGKKGDAVLLSPACASFDLFQNYEDRGRQFKDCVRNL